jgi:hypothetical protein
MCSGQESKSRKNTRIGSTFNRAKIGSMNNFCAVARPVILGKTISNEIFVAALVISAGLFG